jgi:hypothetical protein
MDKDQTHLTDLDINYNIPTSWKAAMLVPSECSDAILGVSSKTSICSQQHNKQQPEQNHFQQKQEIVKLTETWIASLQRDVKNEIPRKW